MTIGTKPGSLAHPVSRYEIACTVYFGLYPTRQPQPVGICRFGHFGRCRGALCVHVFHWQIRVFHVYDCVGQQCLQGCGPLRRIRVGTARSRRFVLQIRNLGETSRSNNRKRTWVLFCHRASELSGRGFSGCGLRQWCLGASAKRGDSRVALHRNNRNRSFTMY